VTTTRAVGTVEQVPGGHSHGAAKNSRRRSAMLLCGGETGKIFAGRKNSVVVEETTRGIY